MIARWTDLHQQAVEVMAREIRRSIGHQWGDGEEAWLVYFEDNDHRPEVFTGRGGEAGAKARYLDARQAWSCHLFRNVAWNIADEVQPTFAWDLSRFVAALFLGHFEAANGRTLEEIVRDYEKELTASMPGFVACHDCGDSKTTHHGDGHHRFVVLNRHAFFFSIALQAVALGANGGKCPRFRASDHVACRMEPHQFGRHVGRPAHTDNSDITRIVWESASWTDDEAVSIPSWFDDHAQTEPPIIVPPLVLGGEV